MIYAITAFVVSVSLLVAGIVAPVEAAAAAWIGGVTGWGMVGMCLLAISRVKGHTDA